MPLDYVAPSSLDEATAILAEHGGDAHLIAGGASLMVMLRQQLVAPAVLVGLRGLPALRGIERVDGGGLRIGALTTHREIERSATARAYEPALAETFGRIATVRIRNQGTIGGNLAHADPAQDPPPMLMALDATVEATGSDGTREIPIAEFFVDFFETVLDPLEILTAVSLPARPAGARAVYEKFLPGSKDDYATIAVAVGGVAAAPWTDMRIAVGAAGPTPMRIREAESILDGSDLGDDLISRAADVVADQVDPIDDARGSGDYKREMTRVWTRRALRRLRDGAGTAGPA